MTGAADLGWGGAGADIFMFRPGFGGDRIKDFSVTSGDLIVFEGFGAIPSPRPGSGRRQQQRHAAVALRQPRRHDPPGGREPGSLHRQRLSDRVGKREQVTSTDSRALFTIFTNHKRRRFKWGC